MQRRNKSGVDVRNSWKAFPPRPRVDTHEQRNRPPQILTENLQRNICGRWAVELNDVPVCLAGTDDPDNLKPICRHPCYLIKSAHEANHMRWHVPQIGPRKDMGERG